MLRCCWDDLQSVRKNAAGTRLIAIYGRSALRPTVFLTIPALNAAAELWADLAADHGVRPWVCWTVMTACATSTAISVSPTIYRGVAATRRCLSPASTRLRRLCCTGGRQASCFPYCPLASPRRAGVFPERARGPRGTRRLSTSPAAPSCAASTCSASNIRNDICCLPSANGPPKSRRWIAQRFVKMLNASDSSSHWEAL